MEGRTRHTSPYPWGFSYLEIDRDLAQQSKFSVRRAAGVMPDGTPFDVPGDSPIPEPIDIPESAATQICWLSMPVAAPNTREVDERGVGQREPLHLRHRDVHRFDVVACASRRRSTSPIRG